MSPIFTTQGVILFSTLQGGQLRYLYHENGEYKREGGRVVLKGPLDPATRFRIKGDSTLIAKGGTLVELDAEGKSQKVLVDTFGNLPIFDANQFNSFWTQSGDLLKSDAIAPKRVGGVLQGQTLFWVGNEFGFGFYRAGSYNVSFLFDAQHTGIDDKVKVRVEGQLLDATAYFTKDQCWFFHITQRSGRTVHSVVVMDKSGKVLAQKEATKGDEPWMESIRGKFAFNKWLFSATDEGLVKLEVSGGTVVQTSDFPDTEPFMDSESHLFLAAQGLYVVGVHDITSLRIS
jgi:H/ACA ribonucleoprotein complex subunit 3